MKKTKSLVIVPLFFLMGCAHEHPQTYRPLGPVGEIDCLQSHSCLLGASSLVGMLGDLIKPYSQFMSPGVFDILHRAANRGEPQAQYILGIYYLTLSKDAQGNLVQRPDYIQSAKWMKKAAEQGYESAVQTYFLYLYEGVGMPRDEVLALQQAQLLEGKRCNDLGEKHAREVEVYMMRLINKEASLE